MSFDKLYWCSKGFRPEDAASGSCRRFAKLEYGCHSCSDWKLMSESEIQSLLKETEKIQVACERVIALQKAGIKAYFDAPSQRIIIGKPSPFELMEAEE